MATTMQAMATQGANRAKLLATTKHGSAIRSHPHAAHVGPAAWVATMAWVVWGGVA